MPTAKLVLKPPSPTENNPQMAPQANFEDHLHGRGHACKWANQQSMEAPPTSHAPASHAPAPAHAPASHASLSHLTGHHPSVRPVLLPMADGHGQLTYMGAPPSHIHVHDPLYGTSLSLPPYEYQPEFHHDYHADFRSHAAHHTHAAHLAPQGMLASANASAPIDSFYEVRTPSHPAPPHHPPPQQAPLRPPLVPSMSAAMMHHSSAMGSMTAAPAPALPAPFGQLPAPHASAPYGRAHYGAPPMPSAPVEHPSARQMVALQPSLPNQPQPLAPGAAPPGAAPPNGQPGGQNERHRVKAALDLLTLGQASSSQPGTPPLEVM